MSQRLMSMPTKTCKTPIRSRLEKVSTKFVKHNIQSFKTLNRSNFPNYYFHGNYCLFGFRMYDNARLLGREFLITMHDIFLITNNSSSERTAIVYKVNICHGSWSTSSLYVEFPFIPIHTTKHLSFEVSHL